MATCYQQVTGALLDLLPIGSRCWLVRRSVIVISQAWLVGIGMASSVLLPKLQVIYRRELGVLDTGLPALEVLEVDLGGLDARAAHEPRKAVHLAAALEPGAGEGVPELMGGDGNVGDAGRQFDSL
jgi:hypothetical protein